MCTPTLNLERKKKCTIAQWVAVTFFLDYLIAWLLDHTLQLKLAVLLRFLFLQICSSPHWPSLLGDECCPHTHGRYSAHYFWQRADWNLSWLVWVFEYLSENVWSIARQLSLQKSNSKVLYHFLFLKLAHYTLIYGCFPVWMLHKKMSKISDKLVLWQPCRQWTSRITLFVAAVLNLLCNFSDVIL